ncbi:MAG TPA: Rv3235 family protein [Pseudonocardiaceae bacterium]|jgi:hypothetical protein|nr:Rv3235 family protein [Pseudonocardiaceae bacterium]
MPPSAAVAVLPLPDDVHIRPLAEHRHAVRPKLTLVGDATGLRYSPPPTVVEIRRLLTAMLEVLDGRRPVSQLAEIVPRRCQPMLLNAARATSPGTRTLRSVHLSRTTADVVDLCARIDHGRRSRALTGRLEQQNGRWQFTMLTMI